MECIIKPTVGMAGSLTLASEVFDSNSLPHKSGGLDAAVEWHSGVLLKEDGERDSERDSERVQGVRGTVRECRG